MENASKALLIAGAILIVILLIAVGMIVYNNSKSTIDAGVAQMDSTEIQMFNAQFTEYEGKQTGTNLKALINTVAANNATYSSDTAKRVGVTDVNKSVSGTSYKNAVAQSSLSVISGKIQNSKTYYVKILKSDAGLVQTIQISTSPIN